jgi:ABC-type glycerol-3-phosphate transport system substrate-binding protein
MRNRSFRRLLSLLLACILLVSAVSLAACSAPAESGDTTADTTAPAEAESENPANDRLNAKDNLPDGLHFGDSTLVLLTRTGDDDTKREFVAEKDDADVVSSAVFERNSLVEDRLGIKLEIIEGSDSRHGGSDINNLLAKTVSSGTAEYDLISNHMSQTTTSVLAGYLHNLNQFEYLDHEQPWWNSSYSEEVSVEGRQYLAVGELALSYTSGMYAMFYNKALWAESHGENELYDLVKNDRWTLDALISYTADYNRDLNGDGRIDKEDICGLYFQKNSIMSDAMAGAAGVRFTNVADGEYDFVLNNERTLDFVDKMKLLLFENDGAIMEPDDFTNSLKKLSEDTALFTVNMLGGTTYLREMENDYGILPLPKLNADQAGYSGFVHNGFSVFGIPATVSDGDRVTAFLEAMAAESYRRVTYAYYDTALKVQYARDPVAAEMLDIISAGIVFDFAYVYNQSLNTAAACFRNIFVDTASVGKAASTFKSLERSTERSMEQLVKKLAHLKV